MFTTILPAFNASAIAQFCTFHPLASPFLYRFISIYNAVISVAAKFQLAYKISKVSACFSEMIKAVILLQGTASSTSCCSDYVINVFLRWRALYFLMWGTNHLQFALLGGQEGSKCALSWQIRLLFRMDKSLDHVWVFEISLKRHRERSRSSCRHWEATVSPGMINVDWVQFFAGSLVKLVLMTILLVTHM